MSSVNQDRKASTLPRERLRQDRPQLKPWWNSRIETLRKECLAARRLAQRSRQRSNYEDLETKYKAARLKLSKAIKASKSELESESTKLAGEAEKIDESFGPNSTYQVSRYKWVSPSLPKDKYYTPNVVKVHKVPLLPLPEIPKTPNVVKVHKVPLLPLPESYRKFHESRYGPVIPTTESLSLSPAVRGQQKPINKEMTIAERVLHGGRPQNSEPKCRPQGCAADGRTIAERLQSLAGGYLPSQVKEAESNAFQREEATRRSFKSNEATNCDSQSWNEPRDEVRCGPRGWPYEVDTLDSRGHMNLTRIESQLMPSPSSLDYDRGWHDQRYGSDTPPTGPDSFYRAALGEHSGEDGPILGGIVNESLRQNREHQCSRSRGMPERRGENEPIYGGRVDESLWQSREHHGFSSRGISKRGDEDDAMDNGRVDGSLWQSRENPGSRSSGIFRRHNDDDPINDGVLWQSRDRGSRFTGISQCRDGDDLTNDERVDGGLWQSKDQGSRSRRISLHRGENGLIDNERGDVNLWQDREHQDSRPRGIAQRRGEDGPINDESLWQSRDQASRISLRHDEDYAINDGRGDDRQWQNREYQGSQYREISQRGDEDGPINDGSLWQTREHQDSRSRGISQRRDEDDLINDRNLWQSREHHADRSSGIFQRHNDDDPINDGRIDGILGHNREHYDSRSRGIFQCRDEDDPINDGRFSRSPQQNGEQQRSRSRGVSQRRHEDDSINSRRVVDGSMWQSEDHGSRSIRISQRHGEDGPLNGLRSDGGMLQISISNTRFSPGRGEYSSGHTTVAERLSTQFRIGRH